MSVHASIFWMIYPWSQSDNKDPSEIVENKTANEAMMSSACSDSNLVTNLIDIYPLYKFLQLTYRLKLMGSNRNAIGDFDNFLVENQNFFNLCLIRSVLLLRSFSCKNMVVGGRCVGGNSEKRIKNYRSRHYNHEEIRILWLCSQFYWFFF